MAVVRVRLPVFAADRVVLHVAYPPLFGLRLRIRWTRFDVTAEGIGARLLLLAYRAFDDIDVDPRL